MLDQIEDSIGKLPENKLRQPKDLEDEFIANCKKLGYTPTKAEIDMHFYRSAFDLGVSIHMFPDGLTDDQDALDRAFENLNAWGKNEEILQDPSTELATHLVIDLFDALNPVGGKAYGSDRSRKTRDAFVKSGKNAIKQPWEASNTYGLIELSKDPWWVRFNPFLLKVRNKVINLSNEIKNDFGFTSGIFARKDLERGTANCMITYIQAANTSGTKRNIAEGLSYLYHQMGLDRYSDPSIAEKALVKANKAIEPIQAPLLFEINRRIGLPPKNR